MNVCTYMYGLGPGVRIKRGCLLLSSSHLLVGQNVGPEFPDFPVFQEKLKIEILCEIPNLLKD